MQKLTAENTNAVEHRLAGDTLVYECPDCEWGEVVVTEMLEGPGAACPDCGARFELFARRVGERAAGGRAAEEGAGGGESGDRAPDSAPADETAVDEETAGGKAVDEERAVDEEATGGGTAGRVAAGPR